MAQLLKSKNLATKFQILLEVAARQPNVQQKSIARRLGITSQAVSEYVRELIGDGWLSSQGRSRYQVTRDGVDWILRMNRELHGYSSYAGKVVSDLSVTAAIAAERLSAGQRAWLYMGEGLLFATGVPRAGAASGTTVTAAEKGQDVGVTDIEGVIELEPGGVTVCMVPGVQAGGSANVDLPRLGQELEKAKLVGAIGVEALVALRRTDRLPDQVYGVKEAAVEAAYCGLPVAVVCGEEHVQSLLERFDEVNLRYRVVDMKKADAEQAGAQTGESGSKGPAVQP